MSLMTNTNMLETISEAIDYLKDTDSEAMDILLDTANKKYKSKMEDTILN